jgi:hypothetical protein
VADRPLHRHNIFTKSLDRLGDITARPPETLHDRAQDLWRPLLPIAEAVGGDGRIAHDVRQSNSLEYNPKRTASVFNFSPLQSMFARQQTDRLSSETIGTPNTSPLHELGCFDH